MPRNRRYRLFDCMRLRNLVRSLGCTLWLPGRMIRRNWCRRVGRNESTVGNHGRFRRGGVSFIILVENTVNSTKNPKKTRKKVFFCSNLILKPSVPVNWMPVPSHHPLFKITPATIIPNGLKRKMNVTNTVITI